MLSKTAIRFTEDSSLYAFVQCFNHLSTSDCNTCLETSIKEVLGRCNSSRGARLLSGSCFLRYERYAFYEGEHESEGTVSQTNQNSMPKRYLDYHFRGKQTFRAYYLMDRKAVKRLSSNSEQGSDEFINEVILIHKLQHINLVKLLGSVHKEEKLLVYEYMPNGSLDGFLCGWRGEKRIDSEQTSSSLGGWVLNLITSTCCCTVNTFKANLDAVLSSLSTNVDSNGFYNASLGQNPDRVNAIVLCRGDIQLDTCRGCLQNATAELITSCPNQKQAIDWQDGCLLRYSNETFVGTLATGPTWYLRNMQNATSPDQFKQDLRTLLDNLRGQAAYGGSLRKVAAGNISGPDFQTIYGLVQCTPDLSADDCSSCLIGAAAEIPYCCDGKQGGRVLKPSCTLRFEIYPFYNGTRLQELARQPEPPVLSPPGPVVNDISTPESLQFAFGTIRDATNDFSDNNKLGQGGFGTVYKGQLPNAQEIAVKRLSRNSGQGDLEFKTEVLLLAKLQHRNLVRPWVFLYKEKRRIIHRDLKASNVLLDGDMNPKIADFGMARLFGHDETQGNTSRIVGTYGYMAPEYAMHGQFSVKSDVFSFGVLVLEIISGQKNNCFRNGEDVEDLLSFAWTNWREGTAANVVDPFLRSGPGSMQEMLRCLHIGLLCVQENASDRPTMASVVLMLSSFSLTLGVPSEPAFYAPSSYDSDVSLLQENNSRNYEHNSTQSYRSSKNDASISEFHPR
ncbi:UNVERIFIED_CONTAM: Cysteine-rich receptor-like protein kinase [Sesamum radiatum]|uniref:Cysteine-rich receptor-like protein kinase n=1 Tax=Sesamum radiatum TaxID=300843 RepID=A0AAW2KJ79_SESRA